MDRPQPQVLQTLDRIGRRLEDALLVLLLGGLIGLAALQIVQRNLFSAGFVWSDELLRLMVLWLALIGAVAASRDDNHINIDVLSRLLPPRLQQAAHIVVDLFTCALCAFLAWHGGRFVAGEREFASTVLGGLPAWPFESVIPVGFGLISWRYAVFFIRDLLQLGRGEVPE